jgi:hypothetical protein
MAGGAGGFVAAVVGTGTWTAQTSKPSGAQGLTATVLKRTVSHASLPAGTASGQPGRVIAACSPGQAGGSSTSASQTTSPSTASS